MTRLKLTLSTTLVAIGLASSMAITTAAQADYPEQDIRLVIPYGPGGATDILFRLISQEAEKHLGESVVPSIWQARALPLAPAMLKRRPGWLHAAG